MEIVTTALVLCTICLCYVKTSLGCNGFQLKVNHIQNCNPKSIIKLEGVGVILDKDCNVIPSGCVINTKRFETAQAHFTVNKPPLPKFEGDEDLCSAMTTNQGDAKVIADVFMIPNSCPVNASRICGSPNKKINISKYKNRLALIVGTISFRSDITHNNGVSCIDINLTLEKSRRG